MSAAESEESRCPDLATASIRTQSSRSTVAQRSSSAKEGCAATRSASLGGGLGSGTGLRCVTLARLAAEAIAIASVWASWDGTATAFSRKERVGMRYVKTRGEVRIDCHRRAAGEQQALRRELREGRSADAAGQEARRPVLHG